MSLGTPLAWPYLAGPAATSLEVPAKWDVALAGHAYMLDRSMRQEWFWQSIPLLRTQADSADRPSEKSINPEDLWRFSVDSWHRGAGQCCADRAFSDPNRFNTSKGVDVWTEGQIGLLPDTDEKRNSANTNLALVVAGARLYLTDGNDILYTTDPSVDTPTWTALTGIPAPNPTSIASDGFNVYTSHTASGIYKTDTSTGATASWVTGNVTLVRYAKGRVIAAYQNSVYNPTAAGALPAALMSHDNSNFAWVDATEGVGQIFLVGYSGDKSEIWRTAVKADGTALDTPTIAGRLPDGEIVRSIEGYHGTLLIGTDSGVRLASEDDAGNLTIGALIDIGTDVRCFEPQGQYVWFGWDQYDGTSTGLGRLDLTQFNGSAPAYASDLMVSGTGDVTAVATFGDRRYLTVSGDGVWGQHTNLVSSGTIDSGEFDYGLPERKQAMFLDVRNLSLVGSYAPSVSVDSGSFTALATRSTAATISFTPYTLEDLGERFEVRLTLTRSGSDATTGPTITRWTMRAEPGANPTRIISVPLLLYSDLEPGGFTAESVDVAAELDHLLGLWETHQAFTYQDALGSHTAFLTDFRWQPSHHPRSRDSVEGTFVARLKVV